MSVSHILAELQNLLLKNNDLHMKGKALIRIWSIIKFPDALKKLVPISNSIYLNLWDNYEIETVIICMTSWPFLK